MPDTSEYKLFQYRVEELEAIIKTHTDKINQLEDEMIPLKTLNKWVMGGLGTVIGAAVARLFGVI